MARISDALMADHRNLESFYDRLVHTDDGDEQTRLQNQFTWELARHVVGEELVVFPALEKHLRDPDTSQQRREHQLVGRPVFCWRMEWTGMTQHRSKRSSKCFKI